MFNDSTRLSAALSTASTSLSPTNHPLTLETLPPPWIRFSLVSIDRRRPRFFLSFRLFLSIFFLDTPSQPRRGSSSLLLPLPPPLPTIQLLPRLHARNAWSAPVDFPFNPVFTDPISYLFLPPLHIILFAITLPRVWINPVMVRGFESTRISFSCSGEPSVQL